jgi:ParB family chromosome partitioning protein
MPRDGQTFELPRSATPHADLFTTQAQRDDAKREKVIDIPLAEIDDFPDHPFQVRQDDAMLSMVESVKAVGVQTPAIARQKDNGRYELISGHRRKLAATLAGLDTMPVIVRDLSRDEAIIAMVDANLQRETILPSEKALSYKMKLDAMKRQAGRPIKDNCSPVENNLRGVKSATIVGEATGDSKDQVYRFVRLTELIPQILQMVDESKIAFRPAVELSYLPAEQQAALLETMQSEDATPSLAQAQKMKRFSQDGKLGDDVILSIMSEEKPNQVEQFKMPQDKIQKFFAQGTSKQKIEETIVAALELYRKRERDRDTR